MLFLIFGFLRININFIIESELVNSDNQKYQKMTFISYFGAYRGKKHIRYNSDNHNWCYRHVCMQAKRALQIEYLVNNEK